MALRKRPLRGSFFAPLHVASLFQAMFHLVKQHQNNIFLGDGIFTLAKSKIKWDNLFPKCFVQ